MEALRALEFYAHADFFPSAMSRDADILFTVAMPWERQGLQAGFFVNQAGISLRLVASDSRQCAGNNGRPLLRPVQAGVRPGKRLCTAARVKLPG